MADRYWRGGNGTWDASTTTNWSATSGGAGGASVPTAADAVIIDASSGSPTITTSGTARPCLSLTTTGATCTIAGSIGITVSGSITLSATTTWSNTGTLTIAAASTITTNGVTINSPVTSAFDVTLGSALTLATTRTFTFTAGTLTLGTFTLSPGLFVSTGSVARTFAFGTGAITTTGSGTAFNVVGTNLTVTGTPTVNISNNSATATTVTATGLTEATAFNVNVTTGTYTITLSSTNAFKSLNFTGFTGTWSPSTATATFYGNLTLVAGMTFTTGTGVWTFANTSGTATITSAGKTLGPITQNGVGGIVALGSALTITSSTAGIYTLTNGTLNLADFTLTAGRFSSNNTNVRVIQFGTGAITVTSTGTAITFDGTNLTYTGTPTVNMSNNSATSTTINTAVGFIESNAFNVNVTTGSYTLTVSSASVFKSLNFAGFAGSWTPSTVTSPTLYGSLALASGMTFTGSSGTFTFAATSGTQTLTSATKTFGNPITLNAPGATFRLADTFSQTTTRTFTYTAGTVDINSQTNTFGVLTITSMPTITNGPLNATSVTQSSGTVTIPASQTFTCAGAYTFASGTVDLATNNSILSVPSFVSTGSGTRTIAFGTGAITTTGSGTAFNVTGTSLTYTGTPTVNISNNSATATTVTTSSFTEVNAFDFNITVGNYVLSHSGSLFVKSLNFTGFTGTYTQTTTFIYGNLTFVSGMTVTASGAAQTLFSNTSGTATLTSAGKTLGPITMAGVGGTVQLADALSSIGALTVTSGTFDANNFNVGATLVSSNNSNTRTITMGSGTWSLSSTTAPWNLTTTTGLTLNKNTANIVLTTTADSTTRTFAGGGLAYPTLTIGGGSEANTSVSISGANSFDTLTSTKTVAYSIALPASITTTVTNFNLTGGAGNLISLISSSSGTQATLSKASGTVNANYLSIQDSNAAGGAVWNAGADSVNVSNNTGWIFSAPGPTTVTLSLGSGWSIGGGFSFG